MKVKEVMIRKYPKIYPDDSIDKAIKILTKIPESSLPVIDRKNRIVGEIDQHELLLLDVGKAEFGREEFDLKRIKTLFNKSKKNVADFMNQYDLTVSSEDEVLEVAKMMYEEEVSTLPVVDNKGKVVGIITDIAILKKYKEIYRKG